MVSVLARGVRWAEERDMSRSKTVSSVHVTLRLGPAHRPLAMSAIEPELFDCANKRACQLPLCEEFPPSSRRGRGHAPRDELQPPPSLSAGWSWARRSLHYKKNHVFETYLIVKMAAVLV